MVMILKFLFNKIFVFLTFLVKGNVEVKDIHHWFTKASSKGDYNMLLKDYLFTYFTLTQKLCNNINVQMMYK